MVASMPSVRSRSVRKPCLLGDPAARRIGGVAQDEQVECVRRPGFTQRLPTSPAVPPMTRIRAARYRSAHRAARSAPRDAAAAHSARCRDGNPPPASIEAKPAKPLVNDSAIQANSARNSASMKHRQRCDAVHRADEVHLVRRRRWSSRTAPPITTRRRSHMARGEPRRPRRACGSGSATTGSAWRAALHWAALETALVGQTVHR